MGRIGINYQAVAKAATNLQTQGLNPTVDRVRNLLGTGSKTTIVLHLKKWRSQQRDRVPILTQEVGDSAEAFSPNFWELLKEILTNLQSDPCYEVEWVGLKTQLYGLLRPYVVALEQRKRFEFEKQGLIDENAILQERLRQMEEVKAWLIQDRTDLSEELKKLVQGLKLC